MVRFLFLLINFSILFLVSDILSLRISSVYGTEERLYSFDVFLARQNWGYFDVFKHVQAVGRLNFVSDGTVQDLYK